VGIVAGGAAVIGGTIAAVEVLEGQAKEAAKEVESTKGADDSSKVEE
jgi:hypothetical protein